MLLRNGDSLRAHVARGARHLADIAGEINTGVVVVVFEHLVAERLAGDGVGDGYEAVVIDALADIGEVLVGVEVKAYERRFGCILGDDENNQSGGSGGTSGNTGGGSSSSGESDGTGSVPAGSEGNISSGGGSESGGDGAAVNVAASDSAKGSNATRGTGATSAASKQSVPRAGDGLPSVVPFAAVLALLLALALLPVAAARHRSR